MANLAEPLEQEVFQHMEGSQRDLFLTFHLHKGEKGTDLFIALFYSL